MACFDKSGSMDQCHRFVGTRVGPRHLARSSGRQGVSRCPASSTDRSGQSETYCMTRSGMMPD